MLTARRELKHRIEALRKIELFAGCTFAELASVDRLGAAVDVPAGRTLTYEGASAQECFVVADGYALARRDDDVVGAIGPGSVAGEMALLDHTTRNATVVTYTPMQLLVLDSREFSQLLDISPRIAENLARIADERRGN
jgi:CRP-like cAMP-binding protein